MIYAYETEEEPMFKRILPVFLCLILLLSACGTTTPKEDEDDGVFTVAATTYPVYLLANEATRGVDNVEVELVIDQPLSCLHDYTLSVHDMKVLERADVILLNGAGLEDSMENALDAVPNTPKIDCSVDMDLLYTTGHDHDHDNHHDEADEEGLDPDPHFWMDPIRAGKMLNAISAGLSENDPDPGHALIYAENALNAGRALMTAQAEIRESLSDLSCRQLITFHDGFAYFADAFDLEIVRAIEEEAGSEASALEVREILAELEFHDLLAIFTEKNGADATAKLIQREKNLPIYQLDLMMSGDAETPGLDAYIALLWQNAETIREAYQ